MTRNARQLCGLLVTVALTAGTAHAQSDDSKRALKDREFDAWAAEFLDLDLDRARESWSEVTRSTDGSRTRNIAFNRFVQVARLTGNLKSVVDVARELSRKPTTTARERVALTNYARTLDRNRVAVERKMAELLRNFDRARKRATTPEERAKARHKFFGDLEKAAQSARRPLGALLLNPARVPLRNAVLLNQASRGIPRDLVSRTEQLVNLGREIAALRKREPKSPDLGKLRATWERLRAELRPRANRVLRGVRAEMRDFQREGNFLAVESLVDAVEDLEQALWPGGRRRLSLRQALRDPIARRDALRSLQQRVEKRLETVRAGNAAHAERLESWLARVKDDVRARRWNAAATTTLEELQEDPFFFPR